MLNVLSTYVWHVCLEALAQVAQGMSNNASPECMAACQAADPCQAKPMVL